MRMRMVNEYEVRKTFAVQYSRVLLGASAMFYLSECFEYLILVRVELI